MSGLKRRSFIQSAGAAGAAAALYGPQVASAKSRHAAANDEIGFGLIGAGGRGNQVIGGFHKLDGVNVVAVADPDIRRAKKTAESVDAENVYTDLRKLLEDPAVDAVVIATCNHWHCLAAVWAMQAGKDVYVEKPLSHSQWEGRQVVKAARKYDRVCQLGTQQRSDPMQAQIKDYLHNEKALGEIEYVQANRFGRRAEIGKRDTPLEIDKEVDYDLWLGPAQEEPIYRNSLHYDWHWDWNTGSGEMGNWGVHVLDDVRNVVFQDSVTLPTRVLATGGRVWWDDAGDTPNVHYTYFDTGKIPTIIALSNLPASPDSGKGQWASKAGRIVGGPSTGYAVKCEGGVYLGGRGFGQAYDSDGKKLRSFKGGDMTKLHFQNFLDAVRSRKNETLNAEIEVGHHSTGWCNLANVGYRVGREMSSQAGAASDVGFDTWPLVLDEMKTQLARFGVAPSDAVIASSPMLAHDPETEQFTGQHADVANRFLKREYRKGYVVPEIG
ncbi:Gfo/Idh/MocA family protein [Alienimonas chondri]|uniref:Inositol 2-dehydrogenase/D-chiro-inositol 3-dehydrogenase n=1 Tax=Alienimonas chondri TaxID=2681879 RepID=A0ABX1VBA4_9PLAN|nr:Gfo/Idh/MocA family oxidoreductase [Alienimonas chondri]NNJ24964.1 Inositol 2-dehydrogenase/D-chiro-inositol 3-dehydrogenase [Alienimonas chondri]